MDRIKRRSLLYITMIACAVAGMVAFEHGQRFFGWFFVICVVACLLTSLEETE